MRSKESFCHQYGSYLAMSEYWREGPYRKKKIEINGKRRVNLFCEVYEKPCPHTEPQNSQFLTHHLDRMLAFDCQPLTVNEPSLVPLSFVSLVPFTPRILSSGMVSYKFQYYSTSIGGATHNSNQAAWLHRHSSHSLNTHIKIAPHPIILLS